MKTLPPKLLLAAAATLILTGSIHAQSAADEIKKLEGTWVGGVRAPAGKGKGNSATMVAISEITFKDGRITSCKDGKGVSLGDCDTLALDPSARTLDATGEVKNGKKGVFQGIYRVQDGKLEWCAANPGIDRPKDFFTTPQVQFHMVFEKKQP
jgi:uncharacterized protein (TIGR03067 family)